MILIDYGCVVYDGLAVVVRRQVTAERRLSIDFESDAPTELPEGVQVEQRGRARLVLRFDRERMPAAKLIAWLAERAPIADLSLEETPIERIVAELYRRSASS